MPECQICGTKLVEEIYGFPLGFLFCPTCNEYRNGSERKQQIDVIGP